MFRGDRLFGLFGSAVSYGAAYVLFLAAFAKIDHALPAAEFLSAGLYIRLDHAILLVRALLAVELGVAVFLCVAPQWVTSRAAAIALLAFFLGVLLRVLLSQPNASTCGCFGNLFGFWLDRSIWYQVTLDAILIAALSTSLLIDPCVKKSAYIPPDPCM